MFLRTASLNKKITIAMSLLEMPIKDDKTVQEQTSSSKSKVLLIAIVAAIGGLLFGFDTGVISGALPFLREYWKMSDKTVLLPAPAGPSIATIKRFCVSAAILLSIPRGSCEADD